MLVRLLWQPVANKPGPGWPTEPQRTVIKFLPVMLGKEIREKRADMRLCFTFLAIELRRKISARLRCVHSNELQYILTNSHGVRDKIIEEEEAKSSREELLPSHNCYRRA